MRSLIVLFLFLSFLYLGCGGPSATNSTPAAASSSPAAKPVSGTDEELQKQIASIAAEAQGKVGVYALLIEDGRTASLNGKEHFVMQSVVKLPVAMAVLKLVSEGKLRIDDKIEFSKNELANPGQRSPLRDENPNGGSATVDELLRLAVSESDGTACDVLTRLAGGPAGLQAYIESIGITDIKAPKTHREFGKEWALQYENWATPEAAVKLLDVLHRGESGIGQQQKDLLIKYMTEGPTGANRIKGLLPPGTPVAHKTGSSGTRDGVAAATNNVGIITMPNGKHIAIAVFVGDSKADEKTREAVIAKTAKAVWDAWTR